MADQLDLVWGLKNIAPLIGRTVSQTHAMLVRGEIPARCPNKRWVVSRAALEAFFAGVDVEAPPIPPAAPEPRPAPATGQRGRSASATIHKLPPRKKGRAA